MVSSQGLYIYPKWRIQSFHGFNQIVKSKPNLESKYINQTKYPNQIKKSNKISKQNLKKKRNQNKILKPITESNPNPASKLNTESTK